MTQIEKREELYRGKAKTLYATSNPDYLIMHFRDDTSAFDGEKIEQLPHKGAINNQFNAYIQKALQAANIPTHFKNLISDDESLVMHLEMIPVECVIRNVVAGSLSRRLGIEEGTPLSQPIFEFFLKNDALHDPMINDSHILAFGWATEKEIQTIKELTFKVNNVLKPMFDQAGMILVDYKLEFGRSNNSIWLGDEFSPDGCRIWDKETKEKLDKDRFRRNLGNVIEGYQEAARRLGVFDE